MILPGGFAGCDWGALNVPVMPVTPVMPGGHATPENAENSRVDEQPPGVMNKL